MSNPETFHILLVHPPVDSPSVPPWSLARTASYLIGKGLSLEQYDANLDFFLNHLLTSKHLHRFLDLVDNRKKQDVFEKASPQTASILADLTENPKEWNRKITGIKKYLDVFRTDDFYEPENYLEALGSLDDLLNLASLAYYPSHIQGILSVSHTTKLFLQPYPSRQVSDQRVY